MNKQKVLLTGAGGRIGPHILPTFADRFDLRVLDKHPVAGFPDTIIADLSDKAVLVEAMQGIDTVVHLAAQSDEADFVSVLVPNNVVGLWNTFDAAREAGVKRIVFASTVQAVDGYPREQTVEITDPPRPVSLYGATKALGEIMGRWYFDKHGVEFVGVRIAAWQDAATPWLRQAGGHIRSVWVSPRDGTEVLRRAVETPDVGYALVFATSRCNPQRLSLAPMREVLGYEPQDDIADIPTE